MKFRVTMKDPDTLGDAIRKAVEEDVSSLALHEDEKLCVIETREERIGNICAKWFNYGEYVTIEIDTEDKTAIVVPHYDKNW